MNTVQDFQALPGVSINSVSKDDVYLAGVNQDNELVIYVKHKGSYELHSKITNYSFNTKSEMAISNDTLVVSDKTDDSKNIARVFVRCGTHWIEKDPLITKDQVSRIHVRCPVDISDDGNTVCVRDYAGNSYNGLVYIYARSGEVWEQQAKLSPDNTIGDLMFGYSVSINAGGDYVVIGAELDNDKGHKSGAAYIYTRSGGTWIRQAKLLADDATAEDRFGSSVSINANGSHVIIGTHNASKKRGAVFIFARSGNVWKKQARLTVDDCVLVYKHRYSASINANGDRAVVGIAYSDDHSRGSAYVSDRSGDTWSQLAKIETADSATKLGLGHLVLINPTGEYAIMSPRLIRTESSVEKTLASTIIRRMSKPINQN